MYLHNYLSHKYGPLVSKPSSICTRLGRLYTKIPQFPFSSTDNSLFTVFTANYCKQVELKEMWTTAEFCAQLPKIELHAHLNGSLSSDTLKRLHIMKEGKSADDIDIPDITKMTNLEECFKIFGLAHSLTSSPEALRVATRDVVREFAEDGVVHLELRTTPRAVETIMSHEQYVEAVLEEATREGAAQGIGVKGVFATTLSNEYYLAAEHFSLSREELWKLSFESVEYTFASEEEKQQIRNTFLEWKKANLAQFELH
ncbi:Adenosine deaminase-like protein [Gryllus bimaculatus]|nr:Adenosine deaminase-like protein [Gryllus bimaculatus]